MQQVTDRSRAPLPTNPSLPPVDAMRDAVLKALDLSGTMVLVIVRGPSGLTVADVSPAFLQRTGWEWAAIVGQAWDRVPAGTDTLPAQALRTAMATGVPCQAEIWCRTVDRPGSFLFGLRLVPTGPGQFTIVGRDITAQDAASRQQRAAQGLLARVFATIGTAIAITDWQDTLLMTNPHFDRMHGQAPSSLTGSSLRQLLTPASRGPMEAARAAQAESHARVEVEHPAQSLHRDGTVIDITLRAVITEHGADRFRIVTLIPRIGCTLRVAGSIRLIGQEDGRRAMGERAMDMAAQVIHGSLAPGDTHSRTDDGGFLICFAGATEEEAQFRAAMIARDIRASLTGGGADAVSSQVTALVATIDVTGTAEHELPVLLHARLGDRRFVAVRQARRLLVDALHAVRCVTIPITDRAGGRVGTLIDIPGTVQRELAAALTLLSDTEAAGFDLNILMLTLLVEQAEALPGLEAGGPVLLPIDLDLLHRPGHAARLMALAETLPPGLRARLTILLGHLGLEHGPRRVQTPMQQLRTHCRDVAFALPQPELPPSMLMLACGNPNPVVALPAARLLRPDRERIAQFVASLHARDGRLLALGAAAADRAALMQAGVDWVAMALD